MRLQPYAFNHHLILVILLLIMSNDQLDVDWLQEIRKIGLLFLNHPNDMICVYTAVRATEPGATLGLLLQQCTCLLPFFREPLLLLFLSFSELPPHLINNDALLLLFALPELLLLLHDLPLDFLVLKLFLLLELDEIIFESVHEGLNIFVRTELATVAYLFSTERAFLFPQTVVGLNTVVAKTMEAALVDDRIIDHFLTDGASQILCNATNEIGADVIVEEERDWWSMQLNVLEFSMINCIEGSFLFSLFLLIGHFGALFSFLDCVIFVRDSEAIKNKPASISIFIVIFNV